MRPNRTLPNLPTRIHLRQMCKCRIEVQLLQPRCNLEILLELDGALSTEIDFSEDRIGFFGTGRISHLGHRL